MIEAFLAAIQIQGQWLLVFGALLAGIVRGFSGFGSAMIFLPIAAQVLSPIWAILVLIGMELIGPLPLLRSTFRDARKRDLVLLVGSAACLLPFGLGLLSSISPETYRYIVSFISLFLLTCLVFGWSYKGKMHPPLVAGIGALAGFSGGLGGVPGPPVILFYMASDLPVKVVRANTFLFLFLVEFLLMGIVTIRGEFALTPFVLGLMMAVPYGIGNLVGATIFDPDKAGVYKKIAYIIIAASAIFGLPFWNGIYAS